MTLYLVLGVALLGGVVGGYLFLHRPQNNEPEFYNFRCPGCKKKFRYQEKQVGRQGRCPACRKTITFPPLSQAAD